MVIPAIHGHNGAVTERVERGVDALGDNARFTGMRSKIITF